MNRAYEDEDLPLPLLRRSVPKRPTETEDDMPQRRAFHESAAGDRLRPASAGALMGLLAGAAGLGVVHAMHVTRIGAGIARMAAAWGVPPDAALPLAYLGAALGGALIGAFFASLTKHLRRFVPLLIWAEVFFVSLTMLVLAVSSTYGHGLGVSMAPAILAASGVFGFLASFQLPLRRRA